MLSATQQRITYGNPIELPHVVSVRFNEQDFRRLLALANTERRNLSQTVRLLIEAALRELA